MFRGFESLTIFSEDPTKLAEFYREKVGLKQTLEAEMGEKNEPMFGFDEMKLYIVHHSEVHGKSKEPERIMFNLEVDKIESEIERLDRAGVKKVGTLHHIEGYGKIQTYEDIDGNYFQIVQVRES
ncbi:VOC family protein [Candidatus Daviesbacteria bacterium]|nr:VOC family protein [Candidatus Daviesbacteria bacterium]